MVKLYVIRHGQTTHNVSDRVQGWCDSPLTQKGIEQAHQTGRCLAQIPFCMACCANLGRQEATARIILAENTVSVPALIIDPRLREIGFGAFEGGPEQIMLKAIGQLRNTGPEPFSRLLQEESREQISQYVIQADPSGTAESFSTALNRFREGLTETAARAERLCPGGNVLIVSSGAIMGALMETLAGNAPSVNNGDILMLEIEGDTITMADYRVHGSPLEN